MANPLAHGMSAMSAYSVVWSSLSGGSLTAYAFLAAVVALLPDLDRDPDGDRSPLGHSVGYAILWMTASAALVSVLAVSRLLAEPDAVPALLAILIGVTSHLMIDALDEGGIMTFPGPGRRWRRLAVTRPLPASLINLSASAVSLAVLLALVIAY